MLVWKPLVSSWLTGWILCPLPLKTRDSLGYQRDYERKIAAEAYVSCLLLGSGRRNPPVKTTFLRPSHSFFLFTQHGLKPMFHCEKKWKKTCGRRLMLSHRNRRPPGQDITYISWELIVHEQHYLQVMMDDCLRDVMSPVEPEVSFYSCGCNKN